MPEEQMWVKWEDGADLSQSRKEPGSYSPLTRDGDHNLGHVTLRDVDEDDEEDEGVDLEEVVVVLAVLAAIYGAYRAAPHLKRWWDEHATPFLKKSRKRLAKEGRATALEVLVDDSVSAQITLTESSREVIAALDEYRASMTSAEALERLVAALVARLYSDEQLQVLRNARIVDEGDGLALMSAIEELAPQELGERIALMLEANPSCLDEKTLADFGSRGLERSGQGIGECVPIEVEGIDRAVRLPHEPA